MLELAAKLEAEEIVMLPAIAADAVEPRWFALDSQRVLLREPGLMFASLKEQRPADPLPIFTEVLLAEAEGQRLAGASKDAMEGGMAFLQKRKPDFKGE